MEGISLEELQLAARNHGMPLEALRYPVTPVGLHYLLIHYDIPAVDPATWRLRSADRRAAARAVARRAARPPRGRSSTVTMECAGNGRARLEPRPVSQPWLLEAVGTARWRGTPLAPLLEEAGVPRRRRRGALHRARPRHRGRRRAGLPAQRSRSTRPCAARSLLAYEMNGAPLPPQHGFPLRLVVPGWYGMTNVKWLARDRGPRRAVRRLPADVGRTGCGSPRTRRASRCTRMQPRSLIVPPGIPEFMTRERTVAAGDGAGRGARLVGPGADRVGRGQRRRRRDLGCGRARAGRRAVGLARLVVPLGRAARASTCSAAARATRPATSSRSSRRGTSAATRTTRCRRCASPSRPERQRNRREGEREREHDHHTSVERPPHSPSFPSFPFRPR